MIKNIFSHSFSLMQYVLIRNEDPWFRIYLVGACVFAFLYKTMKSILEKEVDCQIKKELEGMEKEQRRRSSKGRS